jgi:hypothetical protein
MKRQWLIIAAVVLTMGVAESVFAQSAGTNSANSVDNSSDRLKAVSAETEIHFLPPPRLRPAEAETPRWQKSTVPSPLRAPRNSDDLFGKEDADRTTLPGQTWWNERRQNWPANTTPMNRSSSGLLSSDRAALESHFPRSREEFEKEFAPTEHYNNIFQQTLSNSLYKADDLIYTNYDRFLEWKRQFDRTVDRALFQSPPTPGGKVPLETPFFGQPHFKTQVDTSGAGFVIGIPFGK